MKTAEGSHEKERHQCGEEEPEMKMKKLARKARASSSVLSFL
jgi:hypothetical protein